MNYTPRMCSSVQLLVTLLHSKMYSGRAIWRQVYSIYGGEQSLLLNGIDHDNHPNDRASSRSSIADQTAGGQ